MEFGEVRFGTHKEDKPLVHRITNLTKKVRSRIIETAVYLEHLFHLFIYVYKLIITVRICFVLMPKF